MPAAACRTGVVARSRARPGARRRPAGRWPRCCPTCTPAPRGSAHERLALAVVRRPGDPRSRLASPSSVPGRPQPSRRGIAAVRCGPGSRSRCRRPPGCWWQRPRRTVSADRLLWRSASSAMIPLAVLIVAFVPLGSHALVDHPVGLVWVNALDVVAWAVMWLLGWGPNAVTGWSGGYRFLAMALAYELPLMFAITAPAIAAGSLDLAEIAAAQEGLWFVAWAPIAFAAYCWGVLGFSVRAPMDAGAGDDVERRHPRRARRGRPAAGAGGTLRAPGRGLGRRGPALPRRRGRAAAPGLVLGASSRRSCSACCWSQAAAGCPRCDPTGCSSSAGWSCCRS